MTKLSWSQKMQLLAAAIIADIIFSELPNKMHPVALYGNLMDKIEKIIWKDNKLQGVLFLGIGSALPWLASKMALKLFGKNRFWISIFFIYLVIAPKALSQIAIEIYEELDKGDLEKARLLLGGLVGRDVENLDISQISRATIESVAENTVDAFIAPIFWVILVGPSASLIYRGINTLDAMVGYKSSRYLNFGWASAKLDDVLNFIPARILSLLVLFFYPTSFRLWARELFSDALKHPSPNGGVAEASFAYGLNLKLGGTNYYRGQPEFRGYLGKGLSPDALDIKRSVVLASKIRNLILVFSIWGALGNE